MKEHNKKRVKSLEEIITQLKDKHIAEISIPFVMNSSTREEIISELMLKVMLQYNKNPEYYGRLNLGYWLKIFQDEFIGLYRKSRNLETPVDIRDFEDTGAFGTNVQDGTDLLLEELKEVFNELDFNILQMKVKGYKSKEIEKALNICKVTVWKRYKRIKNKIRELYEFGNFKFKSNS